MSGQKYPWILIHVMTRPRTNVAKPTFGGKMNGLFPEEPRGHGIWGSAGHKSNKVNLGSYLI